MRGLKTLGQFIVQFHKVILWGITIATILMSAGLSKLELARLIDDRALPASNPLVQSVRKIREGFGDDSKLTMVYIESSGSILEPRVLSAVAAVTQALESSPAIKKHTLLSVTKIKDLKSTDGDVVSRPLIESPDLEAAVRANPLVYGKIVSLDLKSTIVSAAVYLQQDSGKIHNALTAALAPVREKFPEIPMTILGESEIVYQVNAGMEKDVLIFSALSLIFVLLSLGLLFGSIQGVWVPLLPVLCTILWTMGLVGFNGEPITLLSLTLPVSIAVIACSCAMHIYLDLTESLKLTKGRIKTAVNDCLSKTISPVSIATLTTFLGALSLLTFKIRPLQHFGWFSAWASIIAMVLSMLMIPAAMTWLHLKKKNKHYFKDEHKPDPAWLRALARFSSRVRPGYAYSGIGLLLLVCAFYSKDIIVGFDPLNSIPKESPLIEKSHKINEEFGGSRKFEIVVDTKKPGALLDPLVMKEIQAFIDASVKLPGLSYGFSYLDLVSGASRALGNGEPTGSFHDSDSNAQYLLFVGMALGESMPISSWINEEYSKARIVLTTSIQDTKESDLLYEKLITQSQIHFNPEFQIDIGGTLVSWIALMRYLVWGKIANILSSLLMILLLISIRYRSVVRGLMSIAALPVGILGTFGVMGFFGIRLDFVTAIITSFAMGIGVDFAVFYLSSIRRFFRKTGNMALSIELATLSSGKAILFNMVCNIVGLSVPVFSQFKLLNYFSLLMTVNIVMVGMTTFILIPALVKSIEPQFVTNFCTILELGRRKAHFLMKVAVSVVVITVLSVAIAIIEAKAAKPELDPKVILKKSLNAMNAEHEESVYLMRLVGKDGSENHRKMRLWFKSNPDRTEAKLLVKFIEPSNIRGSGLLSLYKKQDGTSQWLYLPALKKSRKITAGSGSGESFLGSDFAISDFSFDPNAQFSFVHKGETACGEQSRCHVLEGTPTNEGSAYSKKIVHIDQKTYLSLYIEFHNTSGAVEKVMTLGGVYQEAGKWFPKTMEMRNALTGHRTVIEYEKRDTAKVPGDHLFQTSNLEKL